MRDAGAGAASSDRPSRLSRILIYTRVRGGRAVPALAPVRGCARRGGGGPPPPAQARGGLGGAGGGGCPPRPRKRRGGFAGGVGGVLVAVAPPAGRRGQVFGGVRGRPPVGQHREPPRGSGRTVPAGRASTRSNRAKVPT